MTAHGHKNSRHNDCKYKNGFTLIEILVAISIIAAIVTMVYSSYTVTTNAITKYKVRLKDSSITAHLLQNIARQVRCTYLPAELRKRAGKKDTEKNPEPDFFSGNFTGLNQRSLKLITTVTFGTESDSSELSNSLTEAAYKFDAGKGTLYLSEQRFLPRTQFSAKPATYQPIMENIYDFRMKFYDGEIWRESWNFSRQKRLPLVVRISIIITDENNQQHKYSTATAVVRRDDQNVFQTEYKQK